MNTATSQINRTIIIETLKKDLKRNPFVFACWLEGADATQTIDQYSDIDIWLDVADGKEKSIITKVKQILSNLAPVDLHYEEKHSNCHIRQIFFHLQGTSPFLIVDMCIQSHSRNSWFTRGVEPVYVLFDKDNVIRFRNINKKQRQKDLQDRVAYLKETFQFFELWVQKEILRGHFLEALNNYHTKILEPLIELIRLYYQPLKKDYYLKDISKDVPTEIYEKLQDLFIITSLKELAQKAKKVKTLFKIILKKHVPH